MSAFTRSSCAIRDLAARQFPPAFHARASRNAPAVSCGLRRIATVVLPLKICATVFLVTLGWISSVSAQDIFKGREVNLYVGSGAGGPYDAYARLVARHLGKHLPGQP